MPTGEILELTFTNDHKQLRGGTGHAGTGSLLTAPHWVKGGSNHAVTYTKGTTMSVTVKVKVLPAGTKYKLFGIDKLQMFFNFESPVAVATGMPQVFTLKAKAPLPQQINEFKSTTIWNVATVEVPQKWANVGTTGEHSVFVLLGDPILKNSFGLDNFLTVNRARTAVTAASGLNDIDRIAARVQSFVNGSSTLGTGQRVTIDYGKSDVGDQLWSLLDAGATARGHCGEASFLMEQMLRLLGIKAQQKHVYGRTDKGALDRGENLRFTDESTGKVVGTGPQVRTCKKHGEEKLWLNFTASGYSLNWAEGSVEVKGKLYGGLINEIGEAKAGMTASHDLLLKLEKDLKPRFQVWSSDNSTGCELSASESGAGDPFPPVPSP